MAYRIPIAAKAMHFSAWLGLHLVLAGEAVAASVVALADAASWSAVVAVVDTASWNAIALALSSAICVVVVNVGPKLIELYVKFQKAKLDMLAQVEVNKARIEQHAGTIAEIGKATLVANGDAIDPIKAVAEKESAKP